MSDEPAKPEYFLEHGKRGRMSCGGRDGCGVVVDNWQAHYAWHLSHDELLVHLAALLIDHDGQLDDIATGAFNATSETSRRRRGAESRAAAAPESETA